MKYKKLISVVLAAVLIFSFAACTKNNSENKTDNTTSEVTDITVCLDWTPNTNHTGLYVALKNGYYKDAGLNVTIVQPPENGAAEVCASGQVQFAVSAQDTLAPAFTSETPMDVTAVAALVQHNTSGILSSKGQGMDRPSGMTGKTYLTWDSPVELATLESVVNADGGDWSKVNIIPNTVTDEAQDVKQNPDHAIWVMYAWGGINAKVNHIDTDFFFFKDINENFDFYTPVLIANNDFLNTNPDAAKAFLKATRQGYEFAVENPEEAAQILIESDDTNSLAGSETLVAESQKWIADQYIADAPQWGYIDPARWNAFYEWLNEKQLVEKQLPSDTGFSNDYLE